MFLSFKMRLPMFSAGKYRSFERSTCDSIGNWMIRADVEGSDTEYLIKKNNGTLEDQFDKHTENPGLPKCQWFSTMKCFFSTI